MQRVHNEFTYRRFLPNGKVLSFRANEDQEITDVVHSLARTDLIRKVCLNPLLYLHS